MCGLFGYRVTSGDAAQTTLPDLGRARRALRHRGPDGSGEFVRDDGEVAIGLAHTRLAIVDRSEGGRQPMASDDERIQLVLNGELYNFVELREELRARGVEFRSSSDTEVLLRAYETWGLDALPRLRGMYAFAIWDARRKELILVRDRLGVKPLYYARLGEGIAFASEVRALLEAGGVSRQLSLTSVRAYLQFGGVQEPSTLVSDISSLPPGHFLIAGRSGVRAHAYWQLPLEVDGEIRHEDAIAELGVRLRSAVSMRLRTDVPTGVFLSGGVDSSAILALAAEGGTRLQAFTVDFDPGLTGESHAAAETAARFGCPHASVTITGEDVARRIEGAVAALDQPSSDGPNTYFVSEAARKHGLVVALSGVGGDEVFAGYPLFRAFGHVVRARQRLGFRQAARAGHSAHAPAWLPRRLRRAVAMAASSQSCGPLYAACRSTLFPEQVDRLLRPTRAGECPAVHAPSPPLDDALAWRRIDPVAAYSALELGNYLKNTLLRDTDSMSMAHAVEVREPLLDHQLVEYALRLPGALKLGDGRLNKPLLWGAVGNLQRDVASRPKSGFTLPFPRWLRGPLRPFVEDALAPSSLAAMPWLEAAAVAQMKDDFFRGTPGASWVPLWSLVTLSDWCRRHRVQA